jgi:cell division protease FtsH
MSKQRDSSPHPFGPPTGYDVDSRYYYAPTAPAPAKPAQVSGPLLSDLAGMDEARKWGESLVQDMRDYMAGRLDWSEVDPGCVLHGPPGTGKTTFGKALAATCKIPLVTTSFGEWQSSGEGHLGTLLSAITEAFAEARAKAPCIFFIDELDSIPARTARGDGQYWNAAVNHLLKALDGLAQMKGVVVVGACNHPELLDPALVRAGRLDRQIAVTLPSVRDISRILSFHLKRDALGIDLESLAPLCVGMSGADIERLVREARRNARRAKRDLEREDIVAVLEATGPELNDKDRWRVAVHEAGHAVAALRFGISDDITISIARRGSRGNLLEPSYRPYPTRPEIDQRITTILAGRAAEQIMIGSVSSSAGGNEESDLALATRLAIEAVGKMGLSSGNSLLWFGKGSADGLHPSLAKEVNDMLVESYEHAVALASKERLTIEVVARALVLHGGMAHKDLVELDEFARKKPTQAAALMNRLRESP